jgi:hypothetical protein
MASLMNRLEQVRLHERVVPPGADQPVRNLFGGQPAPLVEEANLSVYQLRTSR